MPDWVQEIIRNVPRLVAVFGLYPASFKVFAWVEDRLSASVKQEITAWLKSTGDVAATHQLFFNLSRFHSSLFGDRQLSLKCIVRTSLFSFASFMLIFFPYIIEYSIYIPKLPIVIDKFKFHNDAKNLFFEGLFVSFILIVLPLDFCGVAVTRKLASLIGDNVALKNGAVIFILYTLIKTIIFTIIAFITVCLTAIILVLVLHLVGLLVILAQLFRCI